MTPPPLAVTVTLVVPVVAVLLAEKVRVELPLPGAPIEAGLKLAVVPLGNPLTLRLTELEVFVAVTLTVVGAFEPRLTVSEVGDSEIVKSGGLLAAPAVNEAIAVLQLKLKNTLFRL